MRILLAGASGFIGKALSTHLRSLGHELLFFHRDKEEPPSQYEGIDAVINLAGESIAKGLWSEAKKERILESRLEVMKQLTNSVSYLKRPPKVFLCASAIGYYGDRGDEVLTEASQPGDTFLAWVCKEWEESVLSLQKRGIRTASLRIGIVLGKEGGMLSTILPLFRLGLGGVVGGGQQWMSWISLTDLCRAISWVLEHEALYGPVNMVSPSPVTNYEFTKTLGKVLHRYTVLPLPAFMVEIFLGQKGRELLLASARVLPKKLLASGFTFQIPSLEKALR